MSMPGYDYEFTKIVIFRMVPGTLSQIISWPAQVQYRYNILQRAMYPFMDFF